MARSEMPDTSIFIDQFEAIGTDVDIAAFRFTSHGGGGAHIRAAVLLMPTHPRKDFEVYILALLDILLDRCGVDENRRHGAKLLDLTMPPAHGFGFADLWGAAVDHFLPPGTVQHVGQQAHATWITFDRVEEQDRAVPARADDPREGTDFQLAVGALDHLELAQLFYRGQIFAQIV